MAKHFCWFKRKPKLELDMTNIPKHIGFIMDGNGRWAKKRGLPRVLGHRAGVSAMERVIDACLKFGVKSISLYAFSTENFKRDKAEVDYIFSLVKEFIDKKTEHALEHDIKINVMGDLSDIRIPKAIEESLVIAQEKTKDCKTMTINLCFSYGGRSEIIRAVNNIINSGKTHVSEEEFKDYLYTAGQADPDLIVRASGERRISNFLLYQLAYSEFYFPTTYWPDFDENVVKECIIEYQSRNRRFGDVKEK